MKNFPVLALLFLLTVSSAIAQAPNRCSYIPPRQADSWLFFQNAGIKFSDAGVSLNNPVDNNMPAGKGSSTISDADGNLILYSDGMRVWNRTHNIINFGPNLSGDLGSTQSSLIVPMPGSPQIFYIFTTDIIYPAAFGQTKGLNYSRIDMSISNNYGAVTDHNTNLLGGSTEMLTGVKHGNGNDFWVLAHGLGNNNFYAYLVTSTGVTETAVQSSGGSILSDDYNLRENLGAMKISPKGDKVAFASFGKGTLELFSFDNMSGRVSSPLILNPPISGTNQGAYYVEFSPDGTKLYVTVANLSTGRDNHLYQYDISTGGSMVEINTAPLEADVSALQLGRDGKIYVSRYQRNMLGVIENPNRPGTACNYNQDGIDLGTKKSLNGLPNFIQSFFDIPPVDYDTKCDGDATAFDILNTSNIDQVSWNFGDAGNPTPGTGLNPTHVFSEPGNYTVTMTETFNSQSFVTIFPVQIDALPPKSFLPPDYRYIFPGSTIPLDAGPDMYSYLWQDGSNNRYFDVSQEGLYIVEYEDIRCCRNSDSLQIIALDIKLPNAFTPNGDNVNDVFRAIGPTEGIEDYTLTIHNRWGQVLWEAANFDDGWDGKFNGAPLPTGVYAWNMTFNVKDNKSDIGKIKYRGFVTLLR
jgi:gliding motility-associated-like protein